MKFFQKTILSSVCVIATLPMLHGCAGGGAYALQYVPRAIMTIRELPEGTKVELSAPDGGVLAPASFKQVQSVAIDATSPYLHEYFIEEKGLFQSIKKGHKHPLTVASAAREAKQESTDAFLVITNEGVGTDSGLLTGVKFKNSTSAQLISKDGKVLYQQTITISQKQTMSGSNKQLTPEQQSKIYADALIKDFKRGKGLEVAEQKEEPGFFEGVGEKVKGVFN